MRLKTYLVATAVSVLALSSSAFAETLKVSSFLPPMHTFNKAIEAWGKEINEKSGGDLNIELFPAGQLAPPPRQFDLVKSGGADMAIILHSATPGRFPYSELAGLPLTHPSAGDASAETSRRLTELAPDYLAKEHEGTRIMWMAVTPPLKLHFTKTDPSDLSSVKGLRVRYAGTVWQAILESMGASPVPVPPAETADAMGKGVVDGASFPFEATMAFDLAPVTKFSLEPGLSSATFALVMSDAAYNRLSDENKKIIDETTGPDRAAWFGAMWDESEGHGREYMVKGGVNIVTLSDEQVGGLTDSFKAIVSGATETVGGNAADFVSAYTK